MKRLFLLTFLIPVLSSAQLTCADIFSDNMILQRDQTVSIWGEALPGNVVEVNFSGMIKQVTVLPDSGWKVVFPSQRMNRTPQDIIITSGKDQLLLKNILIGDVWLCLGQSNMEWPMKSEAHYQEELLKCNQPLLRFYNPTYAGKGIFGQQFSDSVVQKLNPKDFYRGQWEVSDSFTFRNMSALAYYYGKEIINHTGIPTGLIHLAVGGAPIETFINRSTLQGDLQFANKVKGNWLECEELPVWVRERGAQNLPAGKSGLKEESGPDHPFKPGFIFECGIAPILDFPLKGILFYQGESNAQEINRVNEYATLMKLMVSDYRRLWKQYSMPFYFVQLSSIDILNYQGQLWPLFRDEQRKAMDKIKHSGMVVTSDVGAKNDVHPRNKKAPGERLARWALRNEYNKDILPSGPLVVKAKYKKGKVIIHFQFTGRTLKIAHGLSVKGFSLDGISENDGIVRKKKVIIKTPTKPPYIYYGWKPYSDANLVNDVGLPSSTFKLSVQ